jgi:hypothetical protein
MRRREDEEPDKERRAEGEREAHPRPSKRPLQRGFFSSASSARWLRRSWEIFSVVNPYSTTPARRSSAKASLT